MLKIMPKFINEFYSRSLHRQLLEKNIKLYSSYVKGRVLDVGSRNRRYDPIFKDAGSIIAIDIKPQKNKNIIPADAINLPFGENCFDVVVSFEVLEYMGDVERALEEMARVMKKDGLLIFSVPFLDPVHGDVDNVRYTVKSWEQLLTRHFEVKKVIILGGRYSLMWDLFFEKARNCYRTTGKFLLFPALAFSKKIVSFLDKKEKGWRFPMGYFFICKKI